MAYIVAWSVVSEDDPLCTEDFFVTFPTMVEADAKAQDLAKQDHVYCWAVTRVLDASEPHWIMSNDPRIDQMVDAAFAAVFKKLGKKA